MSEMVERVARAMAENDGLNWEGLPNSWQERPKYWDGTTEMRTDWRSHARAAIAAMREPTEAMVTAGMAENGLWIGDPQLDKVFRLMIDEALK